MVSPVRALWVWTTLKSPRVEAQLYASDPTGRPQFPTSRLVVGRRRISGDERPEWPGRRVELGGRRAPRARSRTAPAAAAAAATLSTTVERRYGVPDRPSDEVEVEPRAARATTGRGGAATGLVMDRRAELTPPTVDRLSNRANVKRTSDVV